MSRSLSIVIFGLSLSSSWGNGHATTFRSLIRGLAALGHRVLFLERDVPWYRDNRDMAEPDFCRLAFYDSPAEAMETHASAIAAADAVIVGSFVPDGVELIDRLLRVAPDRLSFYDIDTPVTLASLTRHQEVYLAWRQIGRFKHYFSFSGGRSLRRLKERFGARKPTALYCAVDPDRYLPTREPVTWDLGYLGTYSADRQPALERLLLEPARSQPEMRFVVAGPQYPEEIDWPANVERIAHLPPVDHASFYSRQRFTLNITRADMVEAGWSPSVRLFEAAACGTPIISDEWEGLDGLLPRGDAILTASCSSDVVTHLTALPGHARRHISRTARKLVLRQHTGVARARQLTAALLDPAAVSGRAASPFPERLRRSGASPQR